MGVGVWGRWGTEWGWGGEQGVGRGFSSEESMS